MIENYGIRIIFDRSLYKMVCYYNFIFIFYTLSILAQFFNALNSLKVGDEFELSIGERIVDTECVCFTLITY